MKYLEVNLTYNFLGIWQHSKVNFQLHVTCSWTLSTSISMIRIQTYFKHIHGFPFAFSHWYYVLCELNCLQYMKNVFFPRHIEVLYAMVSSCHFQLNYYSLVLYFKAFANIDMLTKICSLFYILPLQGDSDFYPCSWNQFPGLSESIGIKTISLLVHVQGTSTGKTMSVEEKKTTFLISRTEPQKFLADMARLARDK